MTAAKKTKRPRATRADNIKELQGKLRHSQLQLAMCRQLADQAARGLALTPRLHSGDNGHSGAYDDVHLLVDQHIELQRAKDGLDKLLKEKTKAELELSRRHGKTDNQLRALRRGVTIVRDTLNLLLEQLGASSLLPLLVGGVGVMAALLGGGLT